MSSLPLTTAMLTLLLTLGVVTAAPVGAADDRFLAGYAAAILERQMQLPGRALSVSDGVVTVDMAGLDAGRRESVVGALSGIPGVVEVRPAAGGVSGPATAPVASSAPAAPPTRATTSAPAASPAPAGAAPPPGTAPVAVTASAQPSTAGATEAPGPGAPTHVGLLPGGQLFNPLIADPRWPHFSASFQRYLDHGQLENVGAVSFGETFAIYRGALGPGFWEVGIQAGVFAIFDLDAGSKDLINADYFIAAVGGYRIDRFSALARLSHTSSHLGDEFVLANRVQRVNLSYESVDGKLSYDIGGWLGDSSERGAPLRIYIGGGYLFHRDPDSLKPWSAQGGVELRSPWTLWSPKIRPIAGVDVQMREENNWGADISARAGLQFEGVLLSRNMQVLIEYFHGHSPNGQFYKERIDYLGLGVHFHF